MISFFKNVFLEIAISLMILVFLVFNVVLATASIFLVILPASRKKIKEQWQSFGTTWKRIRRHYKYLWFVVTRKDAEEDLEKLSETGERHEEKRDARSLLLAMIQVPQLILIVAILLNTLYVALFTEFTYVSPVVEPGGSDEPVEKPEYIPTDADKQELDLCPCTPRYELSAQLQDLNFTNVALIEETGETKFSNRFKFDFGEERFFELHGDPKIKNVILLEAGKVRFTSNRNEIDLNPWQAFQFLNSPFLTYMIDESGKVWAAKTSELTPILTSD